MTSDTRDYASEVITFCGSYLCLLYRWSMGVITIYDTFLGFFFVVLVAELFMLHDIIKRTFVV